MIEFFYTLGKDIIEAFKFTEKDKLVDSNFLKISGIQKDWEGRGYTLRWTSAEKIETRKLEGYEIIYEVQKIKQINSRLVRKDGSVLMGKKNQMSG